MQGIGAATAATSTAAANPSQPRLAWAAHEFEAQMMKELIEPLEGGGSLTGSDGDADQDSGSTGALGEFASEALGRALSEQGGFGIASRIVKQLSHPANSQSGNQTGLGPVTGNLHGNTVIRAGK